MKLLYAEDEPGLSIAVTEILGMEGYDVTHAADGAAAWDYLQADSYDAVILDIMMPRMDGMSVLKAMRAQGLDTPVILLTAKSAVDDRVEGLTVGADDYLTKPFAMKELLARLTALLRRANHQSNAPLICGNTTLLPEQNELKTESGSLRLSTKETEMLALLMQNADTMFSLSQLALRLWKDEQRTDAAQLYLSYLETKLRQLRSELELDRSDAGIALKER